MDDVVRDEGLFELTKHPSRTLNLASYILAIITSEIQGHCQVSGDRHRRPPRQKNVKNN